MIIKRKTANNKNDIFATKLFEFIKSVIPDPLGFPNNEEVRSEDDDGL